MAMSFWSHAIFPLGFEKNSIPIPSMCKPFIILKAIDV